MSRMNGARNPDMDTVPSHSIESEQALLGAMCIEQRCAEKFVSEMEAEQFYRSAHQPIFLAIRRLVVDGRPVDIVTLPEVLKTSGHLDAVGGIAYIMGLFDTVPTTANADYYAQIVAEKATLRRIQAAGLAVYEIGKKEDCKADDLITAAESAIYALRGTSAVSTGDTLAQVITDYEVMMQKNSEGHTSLMGQPSGLASYDAYTNGLEGNTLVIFPARPSMGKTSMLTTIACGAACHGGRPGLFVSAEPLRAQIYQRMICSMAQIDSRRVKKGQMDKDEWDRYYMFRDILKEAQVYIDDKKHPSPSYVRSLARRVKSMYGDLGFICVDYIQKMEADRPTDSPVNDLGRIANELKDLSGELDIPVIVGAQLNRGVEQRENKRPMLSDMRDSGRLEEEADIVCALYREEYYTQKGRDDLDPGRLQEVELLFLKQRDGGTGMVKVGFIERFTRFLDLPDSLGGMENGLAPGEPRQRQAENDRGRAADGPTGF